MMKTQRSNRASRAVALFLAFMMTLVFIPTFSFASYAAEGDSITVYMTVSNQGVIAKTNDGSAMANREVKVTDIDGDGTYTFDEALVAAHKAYNSESGYAASSSGWVTKLWSVEENSAGYSFMKNDKQTDVVTNVSVAKGDRLVASVNRDEAYTDWYTYFDQKEKRVKAGEAFTLNLKGFQAMSTNAPAPAAGVAVGTWSNGSFTPIKGAVADKSGNVKLSFNEPGTYIISADGVVYDTYDAEPLWQLMEVEHDADGRPVYGRMDYDTSEFWVGYTEKDYGDGPYPWDEIEWMLVFDEDYNPIYDAETFDAGYLLYTGMVTRGCSTIAPYCTVTVTVDAGWNKIDGSWYYYNADGTMVKNAWKKDSKGWCYLGADGKMVTNDWAKDSKGWVFMNGSGYWDKGTKWIKSGGNWYHITKGYMDTSKWMKDSKGWCYLGKDGKMVTNGWAKDSHGWCWMGSNGYWTKSKWVKDKGRVVLHQAQPRLHGSNEWAKDSGGWMYMSQTGQGSRSPSGSSPAAPGTI